MDVHFSDDLEAKLDQLAAQTGRQKDELVREAVAGYFEKLSQIRAMLDNRYDDIKSGRVKAIDGEVAFGRLRTKSAARRMNPS